MANNFQILSTEIVVAEVIALAASPRAGGLVSFVGTVRQQTQGKSVIALEYEAYAEMAERKMAEIAEQARQKWPLEGAAIHHRVGRLLLGEIAVALAVACPHRAEAFAASQFLIDTLKAVVPIWKKEIFADGEVWVSAHA
ncbi:MAG: molybdenum cofactor biosynthesis protein MoaE [Microscillaceae bacterium]|nr:molybdenum cofactor biosynthesis protein MoaE [Microscillaceae bacterium]